jgi:hypothetical protein
MDIVKIIFPIFSVIGLGYLLRHIGIIRDEGVHMLNQFVYYVSLPAIIFISFFRIDWHNDEIVTVLSFNILLFLLFSTVLLILIWLLPIEREYKAALFAASLVGNTIYMGFPISKAALGAERFTEFVAAATPHLVVGIALALMAVEFFVVRSHKVSAYLKDLFLNPLIISLGGGIILSILAIGPEARAYLIPPIEMLAGTASPLALTTLGAFLYGKFAKEHLGLSLWVVGFKLVIFPFFILIVWKNFFPAVKGMEASFLAAAMPTAVTVFVISERYNIAPKFIAHIILLSTVLSVATIPIALWFIK